MTARTTVLAAWTVALSRLLDAAREQLDAREREALGAVLDRQRRLLVGERRPGRLAHLRALLDGYGVWPSPACGIGSRVRLASGNRRTHLTRKWRSDGRR